MRPIQRTVFLFGLAALLSITSIIAPFSSTVSAIQQPCTSTGLTEAQRQQYSDANVLLFDQTQNSCLSTCSTNTIAVPGAVTGTVSSFVDAYGQYAFDIGKQSGIPYDAILGQAALESGWGKSSLTTEAYNFFGIKVGSSWTGPTITMKTAEQKPDGTVYYVDAAFRRYANAGQGFADYATVIHSASRYAPALTYPNDPFKYIQAVAAGGWASDISYASKVSTAIATVQKYIADKNLFPPSSQVVPAAGNQTFSATSTASTSSACQAANTASGAVAQVVQAAQTELSKKPVEYDQNVLAYTTGRQEAWCADFVSWVFKQGGMPFTGGGAGGWQIPGVLSMQAWFKNGTAGSSYFAVGQNTPRAGDVAFYIGAQTPDGGSTQHVDLVISVDTASNTMVTIGGNESNAVRMSTRQITLGVSSLTGFGRRAQ